MGSRPNNTENITEKDSYRMNGDSINEYIFLPILFVLFKPKKNYGMLQHLALNVM